MYCRKNSLPYQQATVEAAAAAKVTIESLIAEAREKLGCAVVRA
jgi:hypothetical protein